MKIEKKSLPAGKLEITVRVSKSDAQPYLIETAAHLSTHRPIKGFRPGKAPFEMVKREFGEETIMREALEDIINGTLRQVLTDEKIDTYGQIDFDLLPTSTEEPVAYKAIMTLMPTVKLGDWQKTRIKRNEVNITEADLTKALDELAVMTTAEEVANRPAAVGDRVIVDFETSVEGKLINGGTAKEFSMVLGEGRMIPGFEEKIVGAKPGDNLEFNLNFPEKYHAAELAGKPAQFKITVKQILARVKPAINDDFAKRLGVSNVDEIKAKLTENILQEKRDTEEERVEIAAIKQLTDTAEFTEIPEALVADTTEELLEEFSHSLAHQGVKLDQYLASIKKTVEQVKDEFKPKALNRIKSSLAMGKLAENEKIEITAKEVEDEIKLQKTQHAGHNHATADYDQPEYRRHVANALINRKLIGLLKEKLVE